MSQLEKISGEKIVYVLLFLLPIFAVTVRHWVSNIFGTLSLLSLVLLYLHRKQRTELLREERILLWGFAAYFGVFILTSAVNDWGPAQTRYLGVEIRYLMFVPIYLAIRQMNHAVKWLVIGSIFGVIFTAYDAVRDLFIGKMDEYDGVYSPLFTGPIILLITSLLVPYFYGMTRNNIWLRLSLALLACLTVFIVAKTGARNAYVAAMILGMLFIFHEYKGVKRYIFTIAVLILAYASYVSIGTVNNRVNRAIEEYKVYSAFENPARARVVLSSVGTRLEMWRATPIFFKDNPVFGIGRGNYTTEVKKYTKERLLHWDIGNHGHPHNAYSEVIISKGLVGMAVFIWITLYPLTLLIKDYRQGMRSAFFGITHITAYFLFSLTDASTFIKGNYSAIYVIFLAVFFAFHMNERQKQLSKPK